METRMNSNVNERISVNLFGKAKANKGAFPTVLTELTMEKEGD